MAPDRSKWHQRVRLGLLFKHYEAEKNLRRLLFVAEAVDGDAQHGLVPYWVELSSPELVTTKERGWRGHASSEWPMSSRRRAHDPRE